jgi:hypothetical protein
MAWIRYMTALMRRSPALQDFIEGRREQYTKAFLDVYASALKTAT